MIDVPKVIYEYLQANSALTAQISTRLYFGQFPNTGGTSFANAQKSILFNIIGGQNREHYEVFIPLVQFRCYGGTGDWAGNKSYEVYRLLHDAFQLGAVMTTTTTGVFMGAVEVGNGTTMIEPETEWPVTLASFECRIKAKP